MKRLLVTLGIALVAFCGPLCAAEAPLPDGLYAEFTTPRGVFTARLDFEKTPMTCTSFVGRAEGALAPRDGKAFFTGLRWYRVVPGFVIQSGDPTTPPAGTPERAAHDASEDDGPGHPLPFPDEFVRGLRHDAAGILSMANSGPDTNSSEFFVTLASTNRLNYLHSVFGRVIRGLEVLPKIQAEDAFTIKILRVGSAARAFKVDEASFRARVAGAKKYSGPREPGPTAHFDDAAKILPTEPPRAKAFNFKLANFERATGIKMVGRMFAKSPSAAEDAQPGAYMRALAEKLGVAQRGVLVAYFADDDDWRVWIGDELTSTFVGRPGTAKELTASGAIHDVKEAFLKVAISTGDADFARQKASAPPDRQPVRGQQIKLQLDAILDGLILKLEPKS